MVDGPRPADDLSAAVRTALRTEYYALVDIVTAFDTRSMTIKGWSVTVSLAGLGLGFQTGQSALFGLAALTGLTFWLVEGLIKMQQMRYYTRMRDIEVSCYESEHVGSGGESSPRLDWSWSHQDDEHRLAAPVRYSPQKVRRRRRRALVLPHVFLPHLVAVVVGTALAVLASSDVLVLHAR